MSAGTAQGHCEMNYRETRTQVLDINGSFSFEFGSKAKTATVGGTATAGYTIHEVRHVIGYFKYESDYLFLGYNTGYYGSDPSQMNPGTFNPYGLLKPVIGAVNEAGTYYGINSN